MDDDESEIARNTVFAERRIGAGQINFSVSHKVFHHLPQVETHPGLYAETNAHRNAVEGVGYQGIKSVLQRVWRIGKLHVDKPVVVSTFRLLVDDGVEQFVVYGAFLVGMVYIDKVGGVLGDTLVCLDVGYNLIVVIQSFVLI